jgi:hypothetical protein
VAQFRDFVEVMNLHPVMVEAIVYSETHRYAGTLDTMGVLGPDDGSDLHGLAGKPLIIDWKSGSGVYGSYALQLAAYAHAEKVITATGHQDFPQPDGAVVVHITSQGWRLVEVDISDEIFEAFLTTKAMALWTQETSRQAVGKVVAHGKAKARPFSLDGAPPAPIPDDPQGQRRRIKPPSFPAAKGVS